MSSSALNVEATPEINVAGRRRITDQSLNGVYLLSAADGRSKQRLSSAIERPARFSIDEDDLSDTEYDLEQSHDLEPTAIYRKITRTNTNELAPEQNIALFALRLALIEKSASGIGTLSFIWATTIILGGFASKISPVDFIVITLILVTEATRIFSRSRELEWLHLASKSNHSSLPHQTARTSKLGESHSGTKRNYKTGEKPSISSDSPAMQRDSAGRATERDAMAAWQYKVGYTDKNSESVLHLQSMQTSTSDKHALIEDKKKTIHSQTELEEKLGRRMYHHTSLRCSGPIDKASKQNSSQTMRSSEKLFLTNLQSVIVDATNIKSWRTVLDPKFHCGYTSILSTRGVTAVLHWVQMSSVIICLVLSWWRLSHQKHSLPAVLKKEAPVNYYMSLNVFYALELTEALLFLLKRVYWEYKTNSHQLMVQVNSKTEFWEENQETLKQFFYEVYKKCINGNVFDGQAMDIVDYSLTLLRSGSTKLQLDGLRMLRQIAERSDGFSMDTWRRIGTAPGLFKRLVEMLSWRSTNHNEIRQEVAALIYKGIRYSKSCFRVATVPGSLDGIVSLLRPLERDRVATSSLDSLTHSLISERSTALRLDGLRILLVYARDPMDLLKIGETLELVPILVSLIEVTDAHGLERMEGTNLETFDKALRLLAMLTTARNTSRTILRYMVVRLMSGIASLRDILQFGDCHPQLQWMAIKILANLTLEDDMRRTIGSTGGVIRNLLTLYTRNLDWSRDVVTTEEQKRAGKAVSISAGDALHLLAIMNRENCMLMMDLQDVNGMRTFIPALIGLLNDYGEQTICAAKILRSLLEYGSYSQKREIAVCVVRVMKLVMGSSSQKMHVAVVGLSSRLLDVLDEPTYKLAFENIDRTELAQKLLRNLEHNIQVSSTFPRIRRHSIELILALVNRDPIFFNEFRKDGLLERKLMQTRNNVSEAEDFVIFSGAQGLTKYAITMEHLVEKALHQLQMLVQEQNKYGVALETLKLAPVQHS